MNFSYRREVHITTAENSFGVNKLNPEDFWRRLIEVEKECNFESITVFASVFGKGVSRARAN